MDGHDVLRSLERRTASLEGDLERIASALGSKLKREPPRDEPLHCPGCKAIVGWYHRKADVLRMGHMGLVLQVHAGPGGTMRITCPHCGEVTDLQSTSGVVGDLRVAEDGTVVLTAERLRDLLEKAEGNGGSVTVRAQSVTP